MNLRNASALLFVLLYAVALIRPAMPIVDYYIKLDKYLQQCVNKETSYCHGQCVLMQKIQMLEKPATTDSPPLPVTINMQEYPVALIESHKTIESPALTEALYYGRLTCILPTHPATDVLCPPPKA